MKRNALCQIFMIALIATPVSLQEQAPRKKAAQLFAIVQNGKTGFIDHTGTVVLPPQFNGSMYGIRFSEGLAPVSIDALIGSQTV